ncbi:2-hydroxychromene-2-carboxylate isomerase [Falsiroseomonas sp. E2-1-a20]|uniref:2-hydroxychromene-2-carboxylate isomerase n=1 Tax=Falsiroseomonas sp. E2-1-a20 TaxID=3239300 RepID=UPI003F3C58C8
MSSTRGIDFWFAVGSTYTYLSVMRVPEIERDSGIAFRWRPFSVRRIMREMDNRHLQGKPKKYAYMWRDIARRAEMYGLPVNVPVPHPLQEFDIANRVAVLGAQEDWCAAYVGATYRRWFVDGQEPGSEPYLSESLREVGQDPARVLPLATGDEIGRLYEAATDEARTLGVFGSPTFAVGQELFRGDDRLEHAVMWHRHSPLEVAPSDANKV